MVLGITGYHFLCLNERFFFFKIELNKKTLFTVRSSSLKESSVSLVFKLGFFETKICTACKLQNKV